MDGKIYVGDEGTVIEVDMGEDISTATVTKFYVYKPGGTTATWTATIYNSNYLRYTIVTDDLDEAGTYYVQPYLEFPSGWKGKGETVNFKVYDSFK